ncbi:MAG TPA: DUF5362 family protein [Parafilimonas sp.]|nr:DUF5362 family protein [Parafilimonas sp.]
MEQNITPNTFALQVDNGNIPYLAEAAKWGKFLSILGFIFCALIILMGLFAGTLMSGVLSQFETESATGLGAISTTVIMIYYILIALLYFFPCLFLFNFSSKMQTAIRNNDQIYLNNSFRNLKSLFKFWGILTIILLCIFVIAIIIVAVVGAVGLHQ